MSGGNGDHLEMRLQHERADGAAHGLVPFLEDELDVEPARRIAQADEAGDQLFKHGGFPEERHQHGVDRKRLVIERRRAGADGTTAGEKREQPDRNHHGEEHARQKGQRDEDLDGVKLDEGEPGRKRERSCRHSLFRCEAAKGRKLGRILCQRARRLRQKLRPQHVADGGIERRAIHHGRDVKAEAAGPAEGVIAGGGVAGGAIPLRQGDELVTEAQARLPPGKPLQGADQGLIRQRRQVLRDETLLKAVQGGGRRAVPVLQARAIARSLL